MNKEAAQQFIRQYLAGNYTEAEHLAFRQWLYSQPPEEMDELVSAYFHTLQMQEQPIPAPEQPWLNIAAQIQSVRTKRTWWKYAAAAAILIIASVILFRPAQQKQIPIAANAVMPGGNKAMLTLSDGSIISLDSAANGTLAQQGKTSIHKPVAGQLQYEQLEAPAVVQYNTLSTPRGGQYQVTLPDGSKVWLNATSSLRFPTAFSGKERRVELHGEAYFEIAHNPNMPFKVTTSNDLTVTVLGTHFNVMAYGDEENLKTTLLEGAVKLEKGAVNKLIAPGQEGKLDKKTGQLTIAEVDAEEAIAWKNGIFQFENADIATITRQLARWYDVDVVFEGPVPQQRFMGLMSRNVPLGSVLKVLETSGARFKIEGRKLIVMP